MSEQYNTREQASTQARLYVILLLAARRAAALAAGEVRSLVAVLLGSQLKHAGAMSVFCEALCYRGSVVRTDGDCDITFVHAAARLLGVT